MPVEPPHEYLKTNRLIGISKDAKMKKVEEEIQFLEKQEALEDAKEKEKGILMFKTG